MKVVLFCGGDEAGSAGGSGGADGLPAAMLPLGGRPVLWHAMRCYAHWGYDDFVLCIGEGGDAIRNHLAGSEEAGAGGAWRVSFVDAGSARGIGAQLLAARPRLRGEEAFLAGHACALSDHPLPQMVEEVRERGAVAAAVAVQRSAAGDDEAGARVVEAEGAAAAAEGGFFAFDRDIFDFFRPSDDRMDGAFARLAAERLLLVCRHDGFSARCDRPAELRAARAMLARGPGPWELWRRFPPGDGPAPFDWLGPALHRSRSAEASRA